MSRVSCRILSVAFLLLTLSAWSGPSQAKSIKLEPSSTHSTLTLSTSGGRGFLVLPKRSMELNMVGPGRLKITVRLNGKKKRKEYLGTVKITANKKNLLRSRLNLFMSRVAKYKENRSLHPSIPKTLTVRIPKGLQHVRISLKASRRTNMTVSLHYESNADQSAAQEDDDLALVPLVPPKKMDKSDDDLQLVPLVPLKPQKSTVKHEPASHKVAVAEAKKPSEHKDVQKKPASELASEDFELYDGQTKPQAKFEPKQKPGHKTATKVIAKHNTPPKKPIAVVRQKAKEEEASHEVGTTPPPKKSKPFLSIGLYGGEISPFQAVGTSSPTGSLDLRYILPVFDGRLGVGLGISYHRFSSAISYSNSSTKALVQMDAVPISLQVYYRIPLETAIEPFVGAGADLVVGLAEVGYENTNSSSSDTALGFGGHISLGAEASIGPGFITLEVRGGIGVMNLDLIQNLNPSGLSVLAGYRLEI